MKKKALIIAIVSSGMLMLANNEIKESPKTLNDFEIAKNIIGKSLAEAQIFFTNNDIKYTSSTPRDNKYVYLIQSANGGHKNWIFLINKDSIIFNINVKYIMNRESDIQDLYDYNISTNKINMGVKTYRVEKNIGTNSSRLIIK